MSHLPVVQMAFREALRPPPEVDEPSSLLLVRRQSGAREAPQGLVLSHGKEVAMDVTRAMLVSRFGEGAWHWPGLGFDDGRAGTTSMNTYGKFPVRYLGALADGEPLVAWFSRDFLSEVRDTPDNLRRVEWYERNGVPVSSLDDAVTIFDTVDESAPIRPPPVFELLQRHADGIDAVSLWELRRFDDSAIRVVQTGLRLILVATGAGSA